MKPNVFVWIPEDRLEMETDPQFSRPANAGFMITTEGVVVVNTTNNPFHARELLYEIRQRTDRPVRYVVNTDSHGDHMLGNEVFEDLQATILASSGAASEMRLYQIELAQRLEQDFRLPPRMRGIHPTLPTQTFDGKLSLRLGGLEIRLVPLPGGHSPADAVVYLPEAKVLFLGHLYENGYFPRMASSDVRRWIEILGQVEAWDVATYVPSHGAPSDKRPLRGFRQFLEWLNREVETRIKKGQSLDQVKGEVNPLESYRWSARDLAPRAVEAVYRQLLGRRPVAPMDPQATTANPTPR